MRYLAPGSARPSERELTNAQSHTETFRASHSIETSFSNYPFSLWHEEIFMTTWCLAFGRRMVLIGVGRTTQGNGRPPTGVFISEGF